MLASSFLILSWSRSLKLLELEPDRAENRRRSRTDDNANVLDAILTQRRLTDVLCICNGCGCGRRDMERLALNTSKGGKGRMPI